MTSYSLQKSDLAGGYFEIILWSEYTDLVIPEYASLTMPDGTKERCETTPLTYELEQLKLAYYEDYSYYTGEGFWFHVLQGQTEIQVLCDGEHYFWGRLDDPISSINELSIVTNFPERQGSFTVNSVLVKTKEVRSLICLQQLFPGVDPSIMVECDTTQPGNPSLTNAIVVNFKAILACILSYTFGQTYDEDDIVFPNGVSDFRITQSGNDYYVHELWVYCGYREQGSSPGDGYHFQGFFEVNGWDYSLDDMYPAAYDLMWAWAKSCGMIPTHYYDVETSRHQIYMLSRQSHYNDYISLPAPVEGGSTLLLSAYPVIQAAQSSRVTSLLGSFDSSYMLRGVNHAGTPPTTVSIELQVDRLFVYNVAEEAFDSAKGWLWLWRRSGADALIIADEIYFYKYGTGWSTDTPCFLSYYFYRYNVTERAYQRTYSTIKATLSYDESQKHARLFAGQQIDDGVAVRYFYAAEVFKNPNTNQLQITWFQWG